MVKLGPFVTKSFWFSVNDDELFGSPFPLTIYPQQRQIVPNVATSGLVTLTRWTYYRVYLDKHNIGFSVEVVKTDDNDGQPWTYMRYEDIFADIQEPDLSGGIRYELPDARSSTYCRNCRIHVPPSKSKLGMLSGVSIENESNLISSYLRLHLLGRALLHLGLWFRRRFISHCDCQHVHGYIHHLFICHAWELGAREVRLLPIPRGLDFWISGSRVSLRRYTRVAHGNTQEKRLSLDRSRPEQRVWAGIDAKEVPRLHY